MLRQFSAATGLGDVHFIDLFDVCKRESSSGTLTRAQFDKCFLHVLPPRRSVGREGLRYLRELVAPLFDLCDLNGDGVVSQLELVAGLSVLCHGPRSQSHGASRHPFDVRGNLHVDSSDDEDEPAAPTAPTAHGAHARLRDVYDVLDANGDGRVSVPELTVFLTSFLRVVHHYSAILEGHEPMAPVAATERAKRMAAECFDRFDVDRDATLSFDEFVRYTSMFEEEIAPRAVRKLSSASAFGEAQPSAFGEAQPHRTSQSPAGPDATTRSPRLEPDGGCMAELSVSSLVALARRAEEWIPSAPLLVPSEWRQYLSSPEAHARWLAAFDELESADIPEVASMITRELHGTPYALTIAQARKVIAVFVTPPDDDHAEVRGTVSREECVPLFLFLMVCCSVNQTAGVPQQSDAQAGPAELAASTVAVDDDGDEERRRRRADREETSRMSAAFSWQCGLTGYYAPTPRRPHGDAMGGLCAFYSPAPPRSPPPGAAVAAPGWHHPVDGSLSGHERRPEPAPRAEARPPDMKQRISPELRSKGEKPSPEAQRAESELTSHASSDTARSAPSQSHCSLPTMPPPPRAARKKKRKKAPKAANRGAPAKPDYPFWACGIAEETDPLSSPRD